MIDRPVPTEKCVNPSKGRGRNPWNADLSPPISAADELSSKLIYSFGVDTLTPRTPDSTAYSAPEIGDGNEPADEGKA